ncbi:MAG TPA: beta-ketoacyl synthase N-terminal-like domain-containing protein, partial [Candidatus Kapabacteria bacterium]|nr:beta-ketoacyl synthase N-terminal-like domain-containing protein [Candidatus Kapabacteria bacterium]
MHNENSAKNTRKLSNKKNVFAFSGIGAQWKTMGSELFKKERIFRHAILECDRVFGRYAGWSIAAELTRDEIQSRVEESLIAHPCNFALQVALVQLLASWGLTPGAVVGHSSGEVAAAFTAGILRLEDAVKVVWQQCRLMEKIIGRGAMLHISLPLAKVHDIVKNHGEKIVVSSINSPRSIVLSGDTDLIRQLDEDFKKQNIFCRVLKIDIPYHGPWVQPYLEEFRAALRNIKLNPAALPIYSTLNGGPAQPGNYDASYWARHISEKVLFGPAVAAMIKDGCGVFIEIGPHPVISNAIQECCRDMHRDDSLVLGTLKRGEAEKKNLLDMVCALQARGYPLELKKMGALNRRYVESVIKHLEKDKNENPATSRKPWQDIPRENHKDFLVNLIRTAIAKILGENVAGTDASGAIRDMRTGFFDMGLNSLMALQLKSELEKELQLHLSSTIVFDYPSTESLSQYLESLLLNPQGPSPDSESKKSRSLYRDAGLNEPIAIVGMGCRFPGKADNPGAFWQLLENGEDAVKEIHAARWNADDYYDPDPAMPGKTVSRWGGLLPDDYLFGFDCDFFNISRREVMALDPQQRMLLEVCWEALENAGTAPLSLRGERVGVYLGISTDDYKGGHLWSGDLQKIDAYSASGSMYSSAGGRISYFLGLQGPNISVDTACSSSLTALHLACQALRCGECKMALVAGVNALLAPNLFIYFSRLGAMSPDGKCRTFDAGANGYVRGEGCGIVVLKPLSVAQADNDTILAVIKGSALNQDGASTGFIAPNGLAQQKVIRQALDNAGLSPADIDYIEVHGTGTPVGDPIEVEALNAVYGRAHTMAQPVRG